MNEDKGDKFIYTYNKNLLKLSIVFTLNLENIQIQITDLNSKNNISLQYESIVPFQSITIKNPYFNSNLSNAKKFLSFLKHKKSYKFYYKKVNDDQINQLLVIKKGKLKEQIILPPAYKNSSEREEAEVSIKIMQNLMSLKNSPVKEMKNFDLSKIFQKDHYGLSNNIIKNANEVDHIKHLISNSEIKFEFLGIGNRYNNYEQNVGYKNHILMVLKYENNNFACLYSYINNKNEFDIIKDVEADDEIKGIVFCNTSDETCSVELEQFKEINPFYFLGYCGAFFNLGLKYKKEETEYYQVIFEK